MKRKVQHRYAPRTKNKNATELQGCKLRVTLQILSTAYCRADFYDKRNPQPLVVYPFFLLYMCNPVGGFFFLFLLYYI